MEGLGHIYAPDDNELAHAWVEKIGVATNNQANMARLATSITQNLGVGTVGQLKLVRDVDFDRALAACDLTMGYKMAICDYLTNQNSAPFVFPRPATRNEEIDKKLVMKKLESQRDRPNMGAEIGYPAVQAIKLPPRLFSRSAKKKNARFKMPKMVDGKVVGALKPKGPNSVEDVAYRVVAWVAGTYGQAHVDAPVLDKLQDLLLKRFPKLMPLKGKPRNWKNVIKNKFANMRLAAELAAKNDDTDNKEARARL